MSHPSDAHLVREILGGRPASYETLVLRYRKAAFAVALSVGVAPDSAPDVLQEAFLRALHKLGDLRNAQQFGAWFLAIVRNAARRRVRDDSRNHPTADMELPSREEPAWLEFERGELRRTVLREVRSLPQDVREAVFLYYWEGESVRCVARCLRTTPATIKNRLHRGRAILRERLWCALGETLRDMIPSAREERRAARQLTLIVLSTLATTAVAASTGGAAVTAGASTATLQAAQAAGVLTMTTKKVAGAAVLCVLLFGTGFLGGSFTRPPESHSVTPGDPPPSHSALPSPAPARPVAVAKLSATEEEPDPGAAVEEAAPTPTTGDVLVTVIRAVRNEPAADIEVRLVPHDRPSPAWRRSFATTDASGQANFEGLLPGRYVLGFDRAYPETRWPTIEVAAGAMTETRLRLREGIRVEGTVVDLANVPVADADVLVSQDEFDGFSAHPLTTSGPDGRFSIDGVDRGRYVSARKEGYAPSSQHAVNANTGETTQLRLVLPEAGGEVTGRILDFQSGVIPNAIVMVGNRDVSHGSYAVKAAPVVTRSDVDGAFSASGVSAGMTPVVARAPGFAPQEATVLVEAGRTSFLDLALERGVVVQGFVLTSSGAPVEDASLLVGTEQSFVKGTDPLVTTTRSDSDGRYRLAGLAAGSITLKVSTKGLGNARRTLDAAAGESIEFDVELDPPLEIHGRVLLADGTPLARGGVQTVGLYYVQTDRDGRFVLKNCEDKEYEVRISEWGHRMPCASQVVRPGDDEVEIVVHQEDRSTASAKGKVVDADGRSVRSATVRLESIGGRGGVRTESGFFGGFRAGPAPPGEYRVAIEAEGWARTWIDNVTLKAETRLDLGELQLTRPGWLRVDFNGVPAAREGAYFGVFDEEDRCLVAVSLSSQPQRRERLVPGRHRVVIRDRSGREEQLTREFEIVEGQETSIELDVEGSER